MNDRPSMYVLRHHPTFSLFNTTLNHGYTILPQMSIIPPLIIRNEERGMLLICIHPEILLQMVLIFSVNHVWRINTFRRPLPCVKKTRISVSPNFYILLKYIKIIEINYSLYILAHELRISG